MASASEDEEDLGPQVGAAGVVTVGQLKKLKRGVLTIQPSSSTQGECEDLSSHEKSCMNLPSSFTIAKRWEQGGSVL